MLHSFSFHGVGSPKKPTQQTTGNDPIGSYKDHSLGLSNPEYSSGAASIATLEPYSVTRPLGQRPPRFRKKEEQNNAASLAFGATLRYNKFLVIKRKDELKMQDLDMFVLYKELMMCCTREPKISSLKDGTLLIEVSSPQESEKVSDLTILDGKEVEVEAHKQLNNVRGVIRSLELMKYPAEKIKQELADQGVIDVKQMMKTVNEVDIPLPTYVLTFNLLKLPEMIRAAWLRIKVRPYVPSCRRCFYCQRFGHVSKTCRRKLHHEKGICDNCGQEEHGDCQNAPHCINCGENHAASSKKCDRFTFEKEIQTLRAKESISFREARERVSACFIRPGITFASILRKRNPPNTGRTGLSNVLRQQNLDNPERQPGGTNVLRQENPDIPKQPGGTNVQRQQKHDIPEQQSKQKLSGEKEKSPPPKIRHSNSLDSLRNEAALPSTSFGKPFHTKDNTTPEGFWQIDKKLQKPLKISHDIGQKAQKDDVNSLPKEASHMEQTNPPEVATKVSHNDDSPEDSQMETLPSLEVTPSKEKNKSDDHAVTKESNVKDRHANKSSNASGNRKESDKGRNPFNDNKGGRKTPQQQSVRSKNPKLTFRTPNAKGSK